jgi:catechol 2,3-dioxygenase-like lactoylglutathione lyase family enzyme
MSTSPAASPPRWTAARIARPAHDLDRSAAFYRDLVGLRPLGGFRDHEGYDGLFFALPGGGELELTAGPVEPTGGTEEDLLVLYLSTLDEVGQLAAALVSAGVPTLKSTNPYWNRCGQTFLDPDGYRVVIAAADSAADAPLSTPRPEAQLDIDWHVGDRWNCGRCSSWPRTPNASSTAISTTDACWWRAGARSWSATSSWSPGKTPTRSS